MKTAAIVVGYHPDSGLQDRLSRIAACVDFVVFVDNTPDGSWIAAGAVSSLPNAHLLDNRSNLGIATALNQGVSMAQELGAERIFLFDQDSEPGAEIFPGLLRAMDNLQSEGKRVGLVGPAYFDTRLQAKSPFIHLDGIVFKRIPAEGSTPIEVEYLITSGSCINLAAWQEIGGMDESLFIDCVDIEWGLRARKKGFSNWGVPNVVMRHTLGEEPVVVFGRRYALHKPLRHYYFFRNTVLLLKRGYVPLGWKLQELYKIPLRFVVYSLFTENRAKHFRMMTQGLFDGMLGKTGVHRG